MSVRILYPGTVTVCLRIFAERAGEWKSLIWLQVAKSDEPSFLHAWFFCVVVRPTLNGPAATNSRHPPSVLSRPNAVAGKYS
jgi:hypothetical protein